MTARSDAIHGVSDQEIWERVTSRLVDLVDEQTAAWGSHPITATALQRLREFLAGGKRMRALFAYRGWQALGGSGSDAAVIIAAAACELGHACGLIQDDVVDLSDTRHGRPALFRQLADVHRAQRWPGSAEHFGFVQALMLANFCWSWSSRLLDEAGDDATVRRLHAVNDEMFLHGTFGEHLELVLQSERSYEISQCRSATRYKAGEIMFKPPLLMGGILADTRHDLQEALGAFGMTIGLAYQMRDDMLGTFGDPQVTGKPNTDDMRDGKPTVMIGDALQRADGRRRDRILALYGHHELAWAEAEELRALLRETGVVAVVERAIETQATNAISELARAGVEPEGVRILEELAHAALHRDR